MFTIVFLSFHSQPHIKRLILSIEKKYPIIVVENSLDYKLKKELEEKYENVKVIIPPKNLGLSAGYNLAIKESKTNFVFLNPADIVLSNKCLDDLEDCVSNIKDFAILGPIYDDEKIYKNYEIWDKKKLNINLNDEIFKKYKIREVDFIDNDFIINKRHFEDLDFFDENIFLYFDTMDLCKKVRTANKKIYVCEKIKFTHYGSQSVDLQFSEQFSLSRSWHYNWSKFYYFKKNFSYFFALKKIFPNFVRSLKNMLTCKIYKKKEYFLHRAEFLGIVSSIFNRPSSFRPFE
tara:strand:+ start:2109 stop:2978 length:870 start_codon:yes stop_codon:yes gene_type:complete